MNRLGLIFTTLLFAFVPAMAQSTDALTVLEKLIQLYSEGHHENLESLVDPSMIGRQEFIDHLKKANLQQKDIRVTLRDKTISDVGGSVVVIQTKWEKRFLKIPSRVAGVKNGQTLFFIQKMKEGWKLVGQSGDYLFAP